MNASGDKVEGTASAPAEPETTETEPTDGEPIDAELVPMEPAGSPGPTARVDAPDVTVAPVEVDTGYTDSGVPTFDAVRDRIEQRVGRAIGTTELDAATAGGRDVEEAWEQRQKAAQSKLEEIRRSMKRDAADGTT